MTAGPPFPPAPIPPGPISSGPMPPAPIPSGSITPVAQPYTSGPAVMARRAAPPLFGDRWTGPAAPPSETVLAAVAAAGLAFAVAVPTGSTGVGWLSAVAVVLATAFAVQWQASDLDRALPPRSVTAPDVGWITAAVALSAVGTVRAAEWLASLCLLAAAVAVSLVR